jgi:hypothetical protein
MATYNYETHDFYCIQCGNKTLPVLRSFASKKERFHRKKLWCCTCKCEINCVEITTLAEKEQFMEEFQDGKYREEAEESICALRNSRIG